MYQYFCRPLSAGTTLNYFKLTQTFIAVCLCAILVTGTIDFLQHSLRAGSGRFHPDPARKLSANLYDIRVYHCCVYSEKLLMMDRGTVRNM